ncbi:winged helix-turn-helix domain-containing protein [Citrobacter meridianamericanus]|uniref:Winged helix-turn-helix domain-containing protein n=1 Tax=Citrobacter meridianamericanus TaxID=2894201 RepID=A0ABT1BFI8_9ENTR|nr:winged helix-turn-helix domain-containing protein [Citrobacter meridianamericanus]MCO5784642.1 winged helix-turn-helix domain-containing protein [Citrobacter meridianamericanus]
MPGIQVSMKALSGLMYIINNEVYFNEEDGHLENRAAEVSVLMAASTRRLLAVLIKSQGNPVERDILYKTVWDDNGMRSSSSNLNQYISILRKQLIQVGLPDNAVVTIPRVGFMFNAEIDVHCDMPVVVPQLPRINRVCRDFISGKIYYPVFTLTVILLCFSIFIVYFYDQGANMVTLKQLPGYPPQCEVYALPGSGAVNKVEPVPFIVQSCDNDSAYFIFKHAGPPDDRLVASCEKTKPEFFSHCHNRRDVKG